MNAKLKNLWNTLYDEDNKKKEKLNIYIFGNH